MGFKEIRHVSVDLSSILMGQRKMTYQGILVLVTQEARTLLREGREEREGGTTLHRLPCTLLACLVLSG